MLRLKLLGPYKTYRRKVISREGCVAVRSREGHDGTCESSVQVSHGFDGGAESAAPACRRDSNHGVFVSWTTRFRDVSALIQGRNHPWDWINRSSEYSPGPSAQNPFADHGSRCAIRDFIETCCKHGTFIGVLGDTWSRRAAADRTEGKLNLMQCKECHVCRTQSRCPPWLSA